MTWLISNYDLVIGILAILLIICLSIYKFIALGKSKQLVKVKEWLLYACIEAEKSLGSGEGENKLRYVYNLFCRRFPFLILLISFEEFDKLVDQSLDTMQELLSDSKENE